ncbi:hypothetical protein CVT25_014823 [Psilocybe cyanescens]|uniref:Uncharacterized protein n=1 Tax=Psilocybe cyanescens TaxID=93625 RepID=A0A409WET5_PSICY|nr:hypothetical protein CVT25_014823 [Psilocybe cyanescens]
MGLSAAFSLSQGPVSDVSGSAIVLRSERKDASRFGESLAPRSSLPQSMVLAEPNITHVLVAGHRNSGELSGSSPVSLTRISHLRRAMANYQGSTNPLFSPYSAGPVYDESANVPMNFSYQYTSGESSSSALTRNQPASSSQSYLPNDLPELYYDQSWPSPPSATSLNMVSTPSPDWQMSWQPSEPKYIPNEPLYLPSQWQASFVGPNQASRPTIAPIDTNCSWKNYNQKAAEPTVILDSFDDLSTTRQIPSSSYPQTSFDNKLITDFGHSAPSVFSSPQSANMSHPALPEPLPISPSSCPPTTGQAPLKLHQPRPSRRIPIISLSDLAYACDRLPIHSKEPNTNAPETKLPTSRSSMSSFTGVMDPSSNQFTTRSFPTTNGPGAYKSTLQVGSTLKVIVCSCGCGQSTTSYPYH